MLKSQLFLLNAKRYYSVDNFNAGSLCSIENRHKCINNMILAIKDTTIKLHPSVKVAAVLIPLVKCEKPNDEPSILYTLRSNKMRKHIRQVSFPGIKQQIYT